MSIPPPKITYPAYLKLSPKALRRLLEKRKTPEARIQQIDEICVKEREALRVYRITKKVREQAWGELIEPLREEMHSARVSLKYHERRAASTNDPEDEAHQCRAAFLSYVNCMSSLLRNLLRASKKDDDYASPLTLARKAGLPNDGTHWSDWVSPTRKIAISEAFTLLPYKHKAKRKTPFVRSLPIAVEYRLAKKDLAQTSYRLGSAEREYLMSKDEGLVPTIKALKRREDKLDIRVKQLEQEMENGGRSEEQ